MSIKNRSLVEAVLFSPLCAFRFDLLHNPYVWEEVGFQFQSIRGDRPQSTANSMPEEGFLPQPQIPLELRNIPQVKNFPTKKDRWPEERHCPLTPTPFLRKGMKEHKSSGGKLRCCVWETKKECPNQNSYYFVYFDTRKQQHEFWWATDRTMFLGFPSNLLFTFFSC